MIVASDKNKQIQLNYLLNKSVKIYQDADAVKASMDTVLLSESVNFKYIKNFCKRDNKNFSVLSIGCGNGAGDICLCHRIKNCCIDAVDVQKDVLNLAKQNAELNYFNDRINFIYADISDRQFSKKVKNEYDWVMTNPPFHIGETSPFKNKSTSYTERYISLEKWIEICVKRVKNHGYFSIIHKASRIDDIIFSLKKFNMGAIEIFPIFTKSFSESAKRVIVVAKKGSKSEAILHKGINEKQIDYLLKNPVCIFDL